MPSPGNIVLENNRRQHVVGFIGGKGVPLSAQPYQSKSHPQHCTFLALYLNIVLKYRDALQYSHHLCRRQGFSFTSTIVALLHERQWDQPVKAAAPRRECEATPYQLAFTHSVDWGIWNMETKIRSSRQIRSH
jgi:hypothetical protein